MLAYCLTKNDWLSNQLADACQGAVDDFADKIKKAKVRLQSIHLRVDDQIENLHICEDPEVDGMPGIPKPVSDFAADLWDEFGFPNGPTTASGIDVPEVPDSCDN